MKLVPQSAPYIRKNISVKRMMMDVIIALMPVVLFAVIQNGWAGIYVILLSVIFMVGGELVSHMLMKWPSEMKIKELFTKEGFLKVKKQFTINNITAPLISALIYSLIMPAGAAPYVVIVGALFGIIVGKMVFGGLGSNIFNPAAIGRIFAAVCFGSAISSATTSGVVDTVSGGTPLGQISDSLSNFGYAISNYSLSDLFLGNVPGMMGEVCSLLIIIGGIYLFVRKSADIRCALSMLVSFTIIFLVVGIVAYCNYAIENVGEFLAFEILGGGLLFGAVYMITDPVTSPVNKVGRIAYGTLAGIITALIRLVGAYPEGVAFSILIVNMLAPTIDHLTKKSSKYSWKQAVAWGVVMLVVCIIAAVAAKGAL